MRFKGDCNRCGLCCYVDGAKCTNLLTDGARATCAVYAQRRPGMEIVLTRPDGSWMFGVCNHGLPKEVEILTGLIEQGLCSLEVDHG